MRLSSGRWTTALGFALLLGVACLSTLTTKYVDARSDTLSPAVAAADDRWSKYVPAHSRTLAEELRAARENERHQRETLMTKDKHTSVAAKSKLAKGAKKVASATGLKKSVNAVKNAGKHARNYISKNDAHDDEEDYEDDDDDDDDFADGVDVGDGYYVKRNSDTDSQKATKIRRKRRNSLKKASIWTHIWAGFLKTFWLLSTIVTYLSRNAVWTPFTYIGAAVKWSAGLSWQTTQWTGERALIAPVRTASAPLVYLIEGLLFIFVWLPARFLRVVVRELYPVYIFLGAALAVGTAMGIASAIVLYVGSHIFGEQSTLENDLYDRSQQWPNEVERHFQQNRMSEEADIKMRGKKSTNNVDWLASAAKRNGGSIIEQAIRESLKREKRAARQREARLPFDEKEEDGNGEEEDGGGLDDKTNSVRTKNNAYTALENAWQSFTDKGQATAPDSDEEDDYFGDDVMANTANTRNSAGGSRGGDFSMNTPTSVLGLRRFGSSTYSTNAANTQTSGTAHSPPTATTPSNVGNAYGRTLPVGATGQGGWSSRGMGGGSESNSSTPIASPVFARTNVPASPHGGYAAIGRSPMTAASPGALSSHHGIRQRTSGGVPAASMS